jgi:hypothetical protein
VMPGSDYVVAMSEAPAGGMTAAEALQALERLRPEDRALLELSLRREVADAALAELLHIPPEEVAGRREAAMEQLVAESRGVPRAELEDALVVNWRGSPSARASLAKPARADNRLVFSLLLAAFALAWRLGRSRS